MQIPIRPLNASDVHAYKALRDAALRHAPEAFLSDYESAVRRPATAYARRFGKPLSGTFFLGRSMPKDAWQAAWAASANCAPSSATAPPWSA